MRARQQEGRVWIELGMGIGPLRAKVHVDVRSLNRRLGEHGLDDVATADFEIELAESPRRRERTHTGNMKTE